MKGTNGVREALGRSTSQFEDFQRILVDLARIPSVSAEAFRRHEVRRSAEAFADLLAASGSRTCRSSRSRACIPTSTATGWGGREPPRSCSTATTTWCRRAGRSSGSPRPSSRWCARAVSTAAAPPTTRAASSCTSPRSPPTCAPRGALPCNVKFLIEGEEEIGSGNLGRFLERYASLHGGGRGRALRHVELRHRGARAHLPAARAVQVDVEVRCLERPVHSGQRGGAVPDPVQILCRLIADLTAEDGSLNVPGLYRRVARPAPAQRARLRALPFDESEVRAEPRGCCPGVRLAGERGYSVYERLWTRPSLTVIAFESQTIQDSSNQIVDSARARLSMRTVPDMDAREAGELLIRKLTRKPPYGAQVQARIVRSTPWWCDRSGRAGVRRRPARARRPGFGREAVMMGAGGSIGFVQPFSDLLKGAPCLLTGVEDPACGAHSENESLHLEDWKKCMRAAVHLYDELSRLPVTKGR